MKFFTSVFVFLIFILTVLSAQIGKVEVQKNEVEVLLEKVIQTQKKEEKKELIENLKQKLAKKNRQAREESDAIIKAKQKIPLKTYRP